jgi:signal transduction histidine kinase
MADILETLLSTARAGLASSPGRCSVFDVIDKALSRREHGQVSVRTELPVRADLTAGMDADVLDRILGPLLDNANRYARNEIVVRVERVGGDILVTVHDDGPGIPPHLGERAFDPGVRDGAPDGHGGAGLGLPLARRLARTVDGDVTLKESDRGAALVVRLPAG